MRYDEKKVMEEPKLCINVFRKKKYILTDG